VDVIMATYGTGVEPARAKSWSAATETSLR